MKSILFIVIAFLSPLQGGFAEEDPLVKRGKKIFRRKACKGCHVIGNFEGKATKGPDLFEIGKRRDPKWLRGWLKDPKSYIEKKDPIIMAHLEKYPTKMPNLRLKDEDIEAILAYIRSVSEEVKKKKKQKQKGVEI